MRKPCLGSPSSLKPDIPLISSGLGITTPPWGWSVSACSGQPHPSLLPPRELRALSRDHLQGPGQDPSPGGGGRAGGALLTTGSHFWSGRSAPTTNHREVTCPLRPALPWPPEEWGALEARVEQHSQKWRHLALRRGCLRGWPRRKQCPAPSSVSHGLRKECVGSDLERESETRQKPGCEAEDGWGGGLGGLGWTSAKARATTI